MFSVKDNQPLYYFSEYFRLHNYVFFASYHKKFQQVKYCQYNLQQPQGTACFYLPDCGLGILIPF